MTGIMAAVAISALPELAAVQHVGFLAMMAKRARSSPARRASRARRVELRLKSTSVFFKISDKMKFI